MKFTAFANDEGASHFGLVSNKMYLVELHRPGTMWVYDLISKEYITTARTDSFYGYEKEN